MRKKRPLPPVSYYKSADGSLVRNHREHRRHKAYGWYLFETADVAVIDGKIVACQSKSFLDWRWGPFTRSPAPTPSLMSRCLWAS